MRIYKAEIHDDQDGTVLTWHASQRSADTYIEENRTAKQTSDVTLYLIPRGKKGVLKWLNIHFKTDNG